METAKIVMDGEKNPQLQGFSTAGAPIEGTVCTYLVPLWGAGSDLTKDGKLNLDTPQAREPFQLYGRMKQAGVLPKNIAEIPTDRIRVDFQAGNVMFAQTWGYVWNRARERRRHQGQGQDRRRPSLPHDEGGKSATCIGGWQLAVSAYSKNKAEAVKFARWLSSPEVSKMQAIMASHLPVFPQRLQGPGRAEGESVVRRRAAGGRDREVAAGVRAISAGVRRDPQQHERVPRRDQDHRRRARRHEEPAGADVAMS